MSNYETRTKIYNVRANLIAREITEIAELFSDGTTGEIIFEAVNFSATIVAMAFQRITRACNEEKRAELYKELKELFTGILNEYNERCLAVPNKDFLSKLASIKEEDVDG